METTFITIHNLTPEANIMFASESISDILGYEPEEVVGKSCFEYFDEKDAPFARAIHSQGVYLEKAAVLHYANIRHKDNYLVMCECVFTVVHDVLVACTSVYGGSQDEFANHANNVRGELKREQARSVSKRFVTPPKDLRYHMLEHLSSKFRMPSMESVTREPRTALILNRFTRSLTIMYCTDAIQKVLGISKDYIVGKSFYECIQQPCLRESIEAIESAKGNDSIAHLIFWCRDPRHPHELEELNEALDEASDISESEDESNAGGVATGAIRRNNRNRSAVGPQSREVLPAFESIQLEAVISCTSDGLVVILRKAPITAPAVHFAAAPWGVNPIRPHVYQPDQHNRFVHGHEAPEFQPGTSKDDFLKSIQEVAVFAWGLAGINGNIAAYGHGQPSGKSQPPALPIYDPYHPAEIEAPPNQAEIDWARRNGKRKESGHSLGHVFREERNERREKRRKTGNGQMRPDGYATPGYAPGSQLGYANQDNGSVGGSQHGQHNGNGNGYGIYGNGRNGNGAGKHS